MKINISNINVTERIRKEIRRIDELAENIKQNGLLNPVTVMPLDDNQTDCSRQYKLLAGLRRLKAAQLLGWTEIESNVVAPANAEEALRIEISENEQREAFTYSEKMDFARLIEEIETVKAKERMSLGGKGGVMKNSEGRLPRAYPNESENEEIISPCGSTNEIVAPKVGMSRATYCRAKYVAKNAPPETIEQLDKGEKTITGTYNELRAKDKPEKPVTPEFTLRSEPLPEPQGKEILQTKATAGILTTPNITLKADYRDEEQATKKEVLVQRDISNSECSNEPEKLEYRDSYNVQPLDYIDKDSVIIGLKHQIAVLESALAKAEAKIKELEEKYEYDKHTV